MKLLIIGGSGHVGSLLLPYLQEHDIRLFDLQAPQETDANIEYVTGDVCDTDALAGAVQDRDAMIYLAMGTVAPANGQVWGSPAAKSAAFDVNVKGLYLALDAAQQAGIRQVIYASSLSVFQAMNWKSNEKRYYIDEEMPADAQPVYGFTKRLGEEVCRNATREWNMNINVLRLCFPLSNEKWQAKAKPDGPTIATAASDLSRAFIAALEFRAGFQIFHISGDYEEKLMRMTRARQLLNWEPIARP